MSSYYSKEELEQMHFGSLGEEVNISKKCSIYGASNMFIGNNVRIDDFCILSGKITIGNNVHISAYTALYGKYGIEIGNYCGCSPRSMLLSGSDDFSGEYMISPMVPDEFTNVVGKLIKLEDYCQVGAGSIIMPGVKFSEGAICGTFSFVKDDLEPWSINVGIPCIKLKERKDNIKKLSKEYEDRKC